MGTWRAHDRRDGGLAAADDSVSPLWRAEVTEAAEVESVGAAAKAGARAVAVVVHGPMQSQTAMATVHKVERMTGAIR